MKILFKTLLAVTGIVIMVVAAIGILLATVDPDAHRQRIADLISSRSGVDVELGGELSVSYYPWLGASINDVTLPGPSGFGEAPLFHADRARVRLRLMPLLSGQYEIDTLRLHGADINLVIDESGRANWQQLSGRADESTASSPTEDAAGLPLANVVIGGVDIRDARLSLEDRQRQRRYTIDELALRTGELVYGEPITVEMDLEGSASQPAMSTTARLDGVIAYSNEGQRYEIEPLRLDMTLTGASVPDGHTELGVDAAINVDLAADTLNISRLVVDGPGLSLTGTLRGRGVQTSAPAYRSRLQLGGEDLAALFEMAGRDQLAQRMAGIDSREFSISSDMRLDLAEGNLEMPQLTLQLLGTNVSGQLDASGINDNAYQMNGSLSAEGPDLPLLLQLAGQLQGSGSALERYGRQLADLPEDAFSFDTRFDVDWQQGDIDLPLLRTETMGLRLDARLSASDMRFDAGRVDGRIRLTGSNLQPLLAALDQPLLAERLQDLTLETDISGTRASVSIAPLNISTTIVPPGDDSAQTWNFNAEGEVTPDSRQLALERFSVDGPQFDLSGRLEASGLLTAPQLSGELELSPMNPRPLLQQWNQPLPDSAGESVFQRLALQTRFDGDGNRLALEQLALTVDETTVNGRLAIDDFRQPATRFDLNMNRLDLDRYLAIAGSGGDGSTEAETPLPVEPLRTLSADGSIEVGELIVGGLRLSGISADVSAGDGRLEISPLRSQLYRGSYAGDLALDVSGATPRVQLDSNVDELALEPLLTALADASHVSGNGQLQLSLASQGSTVTDLKRNLSGRGEMAVEDGALSGIDIGSTLAQIETMIRSGRVMAVDRGQQTPFETFSATLAISQGAITTNDLLIRAPGFRVDGGGLLADLADNRIDFRLRTTVERGTATTAGETHDIGGYTLPIACRGSLDAPSCTPDAEAVLRQAAGNLLERRIGEFLEDRLGSPDRQQDSRQPDDADSGNEPRNTSDPARELLDRTLEEIFQ